MDLHVTIRDRKGNECLCFNTVTEFLSTVFCYYPLAKYTFDIRGPAQGCKCITDELALIEAKQSA